MSLCMVLDYISLQNLFCFAADAECPWDALQWPLIKTHPGKAESYRAPTRCISTQITVMKKRKTDPDSRTRRTIALSKLSYIICHDSSYTRFPFLIQNGIFDEPLYVDRFIFIVACFVVYRDYHNRLSNLTLFLFLIIHFLRQDDVLQELTIGCVCIRIDFGCFVMQNTPLINTIAKYFPR